MRGSRCPSCATSNSNTRRLEPAVAAKRWPQIQFDGVRKIYLEHEGGYLLARHACDAVARELVRIGGTYRQAAVASVRADGRRPDVRLSDGSTLAADRYVFACGPWLGRLFPDVIGWRVRSTRQEVFYFGTPAGDERFVEPRLPVWVDISGRFIYGIPGNLHRGFKVADDARGPEFDPTDGDRTPSPAAERTLRAFVSGRFPALKDAPVLGAEVCQYRRKPRWSIHHRPSSCHARCLDRGRRKRSWVQDGTRPRRDPRQAGPRRRCNRSDLRARPVRRKQALDLKNPGNTA